MLCCAGCQTSIVVLCRVPDLNCCVVQGARLLLLCCAGCQTSQTPLNSSGLDQGRRNSTLLASPTSSSGATSAINVCFLYYQLLAAHHWAPLTAPVNWGPGSCFPPAPGWTIEQTIQFVVLCRSYLYYNDLQWSCGASLTLRYSHPLPSRQCLQPQPDSPHWSLQVLDYCTGLYCAVHRVLLSLGYYVLAVDYRGYGDSSPVQLRYTVRSQITCVTRGCS